MESGERWIHVGHIVPVPYKTHTYEPGQTSEEDQGECNPLLLSSSFGVFSSSNGGVDLLAILPPYTGRGCTVAATLAGADTDD